MGIQKSGRLTDKTLSLLKKCGIELNWSKNKLLGQAQGFPLELLMVRDDDIPKLVESGVCDLGIIGENVLSEATTNKEPLCLKLRQLGYGKCRLSFAAPKDFNWQGPSSLQDLRVATSYPNIVKKFLTQYNLSAKIVEISGSVELAPALNIADVVCDIVSTGSTLQANGLKETKEIMQSQSIVIQNPNLDDHDKKKNIDRLLRRIDGVLKAQNNKYVMMNAPRAALQTIKEILPGMEEPSVMPLDEGSDKIAIHAVCQEDLFWETMEKLKEAGASSVLVVPIEKVI